MEALLTQIIEILVGGIEGIAEGIGAGLSALAESIFLTTDATTGAISLSTFGGLIIVFAGISLAIGLSTLIFNWLTNLGN